MCDFDVCNKTAVTNNLAKGLRLNYRLLQWHKRAFDSEFHGFPHPTKPGSKVKCKLFNLVPVSSSAIATHLPVNPTTLQDVLSRLEVPEREDFIVAARARINPQDHAALGYLDELLASPHHRLFNF